VATNAELAALEDLETHPHQPNQVHGMFGVALRLKLETTPNRRFYDLFWPLALSVSALALGAAGARRGDVLWIVFAVLGVFTAVPQLIYWLRIGPGVIGGLLITRLAVRYGSGRAPLAHHGL
jgi:hypothetical protein